VTALAIGVAIILLLLGMLLALASTAAPVAIEPAPVAVSATDPDPEPVTVESESEPSGVAGLTCGELLRDAWTTYQTLPESPVSGQFTVSAEYAASYYGAPPTFPGDYVTLSSANTPNVFHVFHMVANQRA